MSKLKNIIKQLSLQDFNSIYNQLMESNADKSAFLLKFLREKQLSDSKIMEELEVNTNAYYTLRSRLNQKIEEFLLQQMESPRTTLIKKVSTIHEIIFTKKKAIAVATLKKLEKELLDYDLSNELTIIYKTLKKLHINSPEHYHYSQLYNKHVAYMLALDKAEDILAEYFKKYGNFFLSSNEADKIGLVILAKEIENVSNLYQSHRLYVYHQCIKIHHRIFVEPISNRVSTEDDIENIFQNVEHIFDQYYLDSTYYHLKIVFEYLKFQYYQETNQSRKAEKYFDELFTKMSNLLTNYNLYCFAPNFLLQTLEKYQKTESSDILYEVSKRTFEDFEIDKNNVPLYVMYACYRSIVCYNCNKYDEAAKYLNTLLNDLSLKKNQETLMEVKIFLGLQYCLLKDVELFNQLINSVQRQVRLIGKNDCAHITLLIKLMKSSLSEYKKGKTPKIQSYIGKLSKIKINYFSPINHIKLDDHFVNRLYR